MNLKLLLGYLDSSVSKESTCNAGDPGSIPGLGRSPGEGNSNSFQYSCLGNPMDRGAWWATVHGIARIRHELATKYKTALKIMFKKKRERELDPLRSLNGEGNGNPLKHSCLGNPMDRGAWWAAVRGVAGVGH